MRVGLGVLLSVSLLAVQSGCAEATDVDVAIGTYTLITVNGDPLPWIVRVEGEMTLKGVSGILRIDPVGCRLDAMYQATFSGVQADTDRYSNRPVEATSQVGWGG